jgi:hypothetical protein
MTHVKMRVRRSVGAARRGASSHGLFPRLGEVQTVEGSPRGGHPRNVVFALRGAAAPSGGSRCARAVS